MDDTKDSATNVMNQSCSSSRGTEELGVGGIKIKAYSF